MSVKGNLEPSFLTGLFQIFCDEKKTGLFKACFDSTQVEIYIQEGVIVYADSVDETHRLCDLLLQRGFLQPDMAEKTETEVKRSGKTVGRILLDMECMDENQLAGSIKELTQDLLLHVFGRTSGEFEYEDSRLELDKLLPVPMNIRQVIFETFRMLDELKTFEKRIPSPDIKFVLCEKTRHCTPFEIDAVQWQILSLVHAQTPVKGIIKASCFNIHTVYKTLIDFMDEEMIMPSTELEASPDETAPPRKESADDKAHEPEDRPKGKGLFGFLKRKA